ncbi:MAG: phosphoglucosamine mutase [Deltaproteobacteria bacterium]|jgi:phosphoglucosamine mutase|nr:phosphoglucosamine mutase [Deltaproteobacteria bacterium]
MTLKTSSAARLLFGTDGIRGVVGRPPMTAEMALSLGRALTFLLKEERRLGRRPKIVIGQDTRLSGDMLAGAVSAGVMSQGGDVYLAGVLPTPGIANLTASTRADAGIVISASHNPYQDNGLKIFDGQGYKLPDQIEARLEALMADARLAKDRPPAETVGRAWPIRDAVGRYVVSVKNTFPKTMDLDGLTIVLDCAHGAAYQSAPAVFEELGAKVRVLGDRPDGYNINQGVGSLRPEICAAQVIESQADLGVALDGDADRAILLDHQGQVVDGDQIMFLCAWHLKNKALLARNAIAATVMSNMGLELALEKEGIKLFRANVGDRYVAELLRQESLNFGGEKSGHLIFLDHATTGDGTLAALQTLAIMKTTGRPLRELAARITLMPQILVSVPTPNPAATARLPLVLAKEAELKARLGRQGRVLLRPSGTEPVVRVMVEGEKEDLINDLAEELAQTVAKAN